MPTNIPIKLKKDIFPIEQMVNWSIIEMIGAKASYLEIEEQKQVGS